jgi:hypothetical protein
MGRLGRMIMLGWYYRLSAFLYFLLWTGLYLMQKTHYNNHYFLLMVLSFVMFLMPAHRYASLDVKWRGIDPSQRCQRIHIWFFILLVGLVYLFASFNKIHHDWLHALPLKVWFAAKADYPVFGPLLSKAWFPYFIAWSGIAYDGLIFFLLLYRPTRLLAFSFSLAFNLFNSAVFQIGLFPYLMIAFTVFFFSPETLRKRFLKKKPHTEPVRKALSRPVYLAFIIFFIIQLLLPLRHHLFPGDVHWTEEGHRLSWQMMLRAKKSIPAYFVEDLESGETKRIDLNEYLSQRQYWDFGNKPDMIWQLAQYIRKDYARQGRDVAVYAHVNVSLNGSAYKPIVDPEVDLGRVPWERFRHSHWILDENRP